MGYLPIMLELHDRACVVVGGGAVAERKVRRLLAAGARVTVISPSLSAGLARLAARARIEHRERAYKSGDLSGCTLAYVATGDADAAQSATVEARRRGILINVADQPALCSFISPAVVQRGDLQIAISSGGRSPALVKTLRVELERQFGPRYENLTKILGAARSWLRRHEPDPRTRRRKIAALAESRLREFVVANNWPAAKDTLRELLGANLSEIMESPDSAKASPRASADVR